MLKLPKAKPNLYTFVPRPVVRVVVAILVLLAVAVAGGLFYTWYMGKNVGFVESAMDPLPKKQEPVKQPAKPLPGANVGVSVQAISPPVEPDGEAYIMVRTLPEIECSIKVEYNKVASEDPGLVKKMSDEYGMVEWYWHVDPTVPKGKWPVEVTCVYGEKSGMVRGELVVGLEEDQ